MSTTASVNQNQYGDSKKLADRARLNRKHTIADVAWFPWVAKNLLFKTRDQVLDIGCGPGWFWTEGNKEIPEGLNLTLSDLSPGMIREAVERCQTLPFESVLTQQANAETLPFSNDRFDAVIAMHMIYHLADPVEGIAEMYRVLKPGGFLAVTTNGLNNMHKIYELATVFGSPPSDPIASVFGFEAAQFFMKSQFGNVIMKLHPARLRVTEPNDVFLALTSYPPGDEASEEQLVALRHVIDTTFDVGNGVLEVDKESGLFISQKIF